MVEETKKKGGIFSISCGATVFMVLYMGTAFLNFYKLMYPLSTIDVASYPKTSLVGPLWDDASKLRMKVYLSSRPRFDTNFLDHEYWYAHAEAAEDQSRQEIDDAVLLWQQEMSEASTSKSFLLTTLDCSEENEACVVDPSYEYATKWLDLAEHKGEGGVLSELKAGEGIESTSVLLTIYWAISGQVKNLLRFTGLLSPDESSESKDKVTKSERINLPVKSSIWSALQTNSTLYLHVILVKQDSASVLPQTLNEERLALSTASKTHSLMLGNVDLIKYDEPHHIRAPGRILLYDIVYLFNRHILGRNTSEHPPWDMAFAQPEKFAIYQKARQMKVAGAGYPFWKPQVSIKYINDNVLYPVDYMGMSGMNLVQLDRKTQQHPTGIAIMPAMHVDEIGLTSEKYIPVNQTLTTLPLRITFDRSDMEHKVSGSSGMTEGSMSPARWRLLSHLSQAIENQKQLGFEQSDIDDLRRLIADTNVTLLTITILASGLHLLFEFLTFKNDVSFWSNNKDLTGLSVRSLFLDMISQVIILLFLIEKDSSLLMTIPTACGCLIALWKCQRGAGFKFVRVDPSMGNSKPARWNVFSRLTGHTLKATRLEIDKTGKNGKARKEDKPLSSTDLAALSIETDRIATRTLGAVLVPVVAAYTIYSLIREEHLGWYSWLITSASSAVYALGFVLMTPQLFLNYKLKSVAHLPWRVLIYRFLNTFIDDLFAFIIRMPTLARISCFRDDIVFVIYLYQRWLYPVDTTRPVEGGGSVSETTTKRKKD
jgi:hypothetical protein